MLCFCTRANTARCREPAEKRNRSKSPSTARTARSSGRSLTANFSDSYSGSTLGCRKYVRLCGVDHYSITELRSSEWRSQPSCPRGQLGQVTLYTDTTVPPILSGATTRLLVNLFEDSFRLHQRYRQSTAAVPSSAPNLWGMGGSDRRNFASA